MRISARQGKHNVIGEDPTLFNVKSQNANKNRTDPVLIFVSSN